MSSGPQELKQSDESSKGVSQAPEAKGTKEKPRVNLVIVTSAEKLATEVKDKGFIFGLMGNQLVRLDYAAKQGHAPESKGDVPESKNDVPKSKDDASEAGELKISDLEMSLAQLMTVRFYLAADLMRGKPSETLSFKTRQELLEIILSKGICSFETAAVDEKK